MKRVPLHSIGLFVLLLVPSTFACGTSSVSEDAESVTTVFLVRHAEKDSVGDDPELTVDGVERAAALAHVLGEVNVNAVYSTPFARTRTTAIPLANTLGMEVIEISVGQSFATQMAEIVRTDHLGETVVIVSHSNTTPEIIGELGVSPIPVIEDDEYDDLYVVTITSTGYASLLPLRYGRETN